MKKYPHKLELYRLAVQHPPSEVSFLLRAHSHYSPHGVPTLLRDDFCGGAAIAAHWVSLHENHRAMALDLHQPTLRWAWKRWSSELGEQAEDLHLLDMDVRTVTNPKVDVIAAMNFGAFTFHDRATLLAYFKAARKSLRTGGIFVIDAYGGPGAMVNKIQKRKVDPALRDAGNSNVELFEYLWEQKKYDAVHNRVDCRIHFVFSDGKKYLNAFRYDWRLWSLTELVEVMHEAGFDQAQVWSENISLARSAHHARQFSPVAAMPNVSEWVAYVVGHVAPSRNRRRA